MCPIENKGSGKGSVMWQEKQILSFHLNSWRKKTTFEIMLSAWLTIISRLQCKTFFEGCKRAVRPVKSVAGLEQGHTFIGLDTKSGNLSPLSDPISWLPPPPTHTQAFPAVTVSPINVNTELHHWGRETKTYRQSNMLRKNSFLLPMWFIISLSKCFSWNIKVSVEVRSWCFH